MCCDTNVLWCGGCNMLCSAPRQQRSTKQKPQKLLMLACRPTHHLPAAPRICCTATATCTPSSAAHGSSLGQWKLQGRFTTMVPGTPKRPLGIAATSYAAWRCMVAVSLLPMSLVTAAAPSAPLVPAPPLVSPVPVPPVSLVVVAAAPEPGAAPAGAASAGLFSAVAAPAAPAMRLLPPAAPRLPFSTAPPPPSARPAAAASAAPALRPPPSASPPASCLLSPPPRCLGPGELESTSKVLLPQSTAAPSQETAATIPCSTPAPSRSAAHEVGSSLPRCSSSCCCCRCSPPCCRGRLLDGCCAAGATTSGGCSSARSSERTSAVPAGAPAGAAAAASAAVAAAAGAAAAALTDHAALLPSKPSRLTAGKRCSSACAPTPSSPPPAGWGCCACSAVPAAPAMASAPDCCCSAAVLRRPLGLKGTASGAMLCARTQKRRKRLFQQVQRIKASQKMAPWTVVLAQLALLTAMALAASYGAMPTSVCSGAGTRCRGRSVAGVHACHVAQQ